MKARVREDLDIDTRVPIDNGEYIPNDGTWYEAWQPDELDNDEFNLVLLYNGQLVRALTIDFDFRLEGKHN